MKTWIPTKKWFAALTTGLLTVFTHWLSTGEFDGTERGGLVTLLIALTAAYWKSNDDTPGGVPASDEGATEQPDAPEGEVGE